MAAQKVFNDENLREYIFSYIYGFEHILQNDKVYIFLHHDHNKKYMSLLTDEIFDMAAEYGSIKILQWLYHSLNIKGTELALDMAIYDGNFEIINFIHQNCKDGCSFEALKYATEQNNMPIIKWLLKNYSYVFSLTSYIDALKICIEYNYIECFEFFYDVYKAKFNRKKLCLPQTVLNDAIIYGRLELVKWIDVRCAVRSCKEILLASRYGHIDILIWLYENRFHELYMNSLYTESLSKSIIYASECGHQHIVKYIVNKIANIRSKILREAVNRAALNGNIEIIVYLDHIYYNRRIFTNLTISYAAEGGHLNIIKYICSKKHNLSAIIGGQITNRSNMDSAAKNGHLFIIKWLNENLYEDSPKKILNYACMSGYLDIVRWITINRPDITCTERAMDLAAINGHLELVKWLYIFRKEGCTSKAIIGSAMNGYLPTLEFIHYHYSLQANNEAMDYAAMKGNLHIIKWLHENRTEGCSINAMNLAAKNGHFEIIKWLHENRTEGCSTNAMDLAAMNGHFNIVKWLHKNRTEGCGRMAINGAANNGHITIVKYLLNNTKTTFDISTIYTTYCKGRFTISKLLDDNRPRSI